MPDKPAYADDDLLFIGDAAEFVGVHTDTLRRWEERGLVAAVRTPGNQRRFRVADLRPLIEPASATTTQSAEGAA